MPPPGPVSIMIGLVLIMVYFIHELFRFPLANASPFVRAFCPCLLQNGVAFRIINDLLFDAVLNVNQT